MPHFQKQFSQYEKTVVTSCEYHAPGGGRNGFGKPSGNNCASAVFPTASAPTVAHDSLMKSLRSTLTRDLLDRPSQEVGDGSVERAGVALGDGVRVPLEPGGDEPFQQGKCGIATAAAHEQRTAFRDGREMVGKIPPRVLDLDAVVGEGGS